MQLSDDAIARIKEEMSRNNINQKSLSVDTGIHPSNLSSYLSGKKPISSKTLDRIGRVLNVSPRWILYGDETFIHYQNACRENIYHRLQAAITDKNLSDDQLVLMYSVLGLTKEQTTSLINLVKSLYRNEYYLHSVDYAYTLAERQALKEQQAEIEKIYPPMSKEEEQKWVNEQYRLYSSAEDEKAWEERTIAEWGSIENYLKCIDATPSERAKMYLDPPIF